MYSILSSQLGLLLGALALPIVIILLFLKELSKPVDKKWKLRGKKWNLPPGPKGSPIVGNLLQFSQARNTGNLIPYVGTCNFHTDSPSFPSAWTYANIDLLYSLIPWETMGR